MLTEIGDFGVKGSSYWRKGQTLCLAEIGPVLN